MLLGGGPSTYPDHSDLGECKSACKEMLDDGRTICDQEYGQPYNNIKLHNIQCDEDQEADHVNDWSNLAKVGNNQEVYADWLKCYRAALDAWGICIQKCAGLYLGVGSSAGNVSDFGPQIFQ